jgi:hypothetical protein
VAGHKRIRPLLKKQGLKVDDGVILAPKVGKERLASAVTLVANASKEVAHWGLRHLRASKPKNLFQAIDRIITTSHGVAFLSRHETFVGASNKQHAFAFVLRTSDRRIVLIDPVVNDPSSINSKVVAHMDIRQVGDSAIDQRLVYDEDEMWDAADLNLLKVGATPVPLSGFNGVLERIVS